MTDAIADRGMRIVVCDRAKRYSAPRTRSCRYSIGVDIVA
ncbi:hypothetical protein SPHINGO8AM_80178 [Sphingomonas sp. 8AM]|nr:hypothetical protein SPHINGO8AM_80178 [Sphingomonas sp. 8AM]